MAEFCRKCCKEVMGIDPDKHPEWIVENEGICEGCGYKYLKLENR